MTIGSLRDAGVNGYHWSRTAYLSELTAYNLNFDNPDAYPSSYTVRWLGFTV